MLVTNKVFLLAILFSFACNFPIKKSTKWNFYDNGIRKALIDNLKPLSRRNDVGELWENYLMVERLKKNNYEQNFKEIYFWRTYDQQEIDCIEEKNQENIFKKMGKAMPKWTDLIDRSFMNDAFKKQYKTIVKERMHRLQ